MLPDGALEISWNISESVHLSSLSFKNSCNVSSRGENDRDYLEPRFKSNGYSRHSMMAEEKVGSGIQSFLVSVSLIGGRASYDPLNVPPFYFNSIASERARKRRGQKVDPPSLSFSLEDYLKL